jgi:hypothetical protein
MVIDQFHDPVLGTLAKIASDRPRLASAVMSFDVDPSERERLPDHAFAWPEKRAYPVHSREHAMLSRAYRDGVGGRVPAHVDATIKEALAVYGVDEAMFARAKVASAPPVDDASDYLLPDIRRLRVTEPGHVKVAADRLAQQGDRLSPGHRVLAGSRLVEKAAFFGVRVGDEVRRMAGLVATSTPVLADWLEARGQAASAEFRDGYDKLASEVRRMPDELLDRGIQARLASAIEELDGLSGLDRQWGRRLPDPHASVFNTTKVAGPGVTLAGRFIPMERMAAYPTSFYADALGPDIVREATDLGGRLDVEKLAAVLGTLPIDMQRALVSCMGA